MKGPPLRIVVLMIMAWCTGIFLYFKGGVDPKLHVLRLLSFPNLILAALLTLAVIRGQRS